MVLGIIAIVASLFLFFLPIGLVLGIIAVVMGAKQVKQFGPMVGQKGRTGKICGIVAIVISTIALVITIAGVALFGSVMNEIIEEGGMGSGGSSMVAPIGPSDDFAEDSAEAAVEVAFNRDMDAMLSGQNDALLVVVQSMMDDIDADAGPDELSFSLMGLSAEDITAKMASTVSYQVTDLDYIGAEDKVWVTADVKVVSLNSQIDEFERIYEADTRTFATPEEYGAACGEMYMSAFDTAPTVTTQVMAEYYLVDGEWQLLDSDWTYLPESIAYATEV